MVVSLGLVLLEASKKQANGLPALQRRD